MEQLNELLNTLEDILTEIDDTELATSGPELIKQIENYLSGPEATTVIEEMVEQADLSGYEPTQLNIEIEQLREATINLLLSLQEKYASSSIKTSFLTKLQELITSFFGAAALYAASRDTATVGVELIHPAAKLPTYAHEGDQGADVYAVEDITIEPYTFGNMIPTGLKLLIPKGWAISIRPRSGMSKNTPLRISNSPATIDQQYRGEVKVLFDNFSSQPVTIKAGERIAQFILEKNYPANWRQVDTVEPTTDRGEGGFGSSGN